MRTHWKQHTWNAICDVCGFKFNSTKLRERWDGLRVCKDDWEVRHPLDLVNIKVHAQTIDWARPDDGAVAYQEVGDASVTLVAGTSLTIQLFSSPLTANRTVTLNNGTREGQSFTIIRKGHGAFTLTIGSLYTIPINKGGQVVVSWTGQVWKLDAATLFDTTIL